MKSTNTTSILLLSILLFVAFHCGEVEQDLFPPFTSSYKPLDCNWTVHACSVDTCETGANFSLKANYRDLKACDCHPDCFTYGSCCANYEAVCQQGQADREDRAQKNIVSCEPMPSDLKKSGLTFVVTKCLRPLLGNVTTTDVEFCEHPNKSFDQLVAVYKEPLLYRNVYCLRCNGHSLDEADQVVGTDIICREDYLRIKNLETDFEALTFSQLNELVSLGECRIMYKKEFPELYCYENYIDTCDESLKSEIPDFDLLEEACRGHAFYITISDASDNYERKYFKNMQCAECNGFIPSELRQCINESIPVKFTQSTKFKFVRTLSIIMDFSGEVSTRLTALRVCSEPSSQGLVNIATNRCASKLCPPDFILFNASHCITNESLTFNNLLPGGTFENTIKISLCYAPETLEGDINDELEKIIYESRVQHIIIFHTVVSHQDDRSCVDVIVFSTNILIDLFHFSMLTPVHELNGNLSIYSMNLVIPQALDAVREDTKSHHQVHPELLRKNNFYLNFDSGKHYAFTDSFVFVPEFDVFLKPEQMFFDIKIEKLDDGSWSSSLTGFVKVERHFDCSEHLCTPIHPLPVDLDISLQGMLTAIGTYLSIGTSSVSIVVRLVLGPKSFPFLVQTLIQITILLANVFYLTSSSTSYSNAVCAGLAAAQHYFWLASFAFMNVLGAVQFKAFRLVVNQESLGARKKGLYIAYGWAFPALIVAACLTLHFLVHPVYTSRDVCWIGNKVDLGLAFGLPVGLMLLFNIVIFILTSRALKKSMNEAKFASHAYDAKFRLGLQLRLFCISGGTWVLGFLSNIPKLQFLSYPFVVLVSLNGCFVAINFTFNTQTRDIVKRMFPSIFSSHSGNSRTPT